MANSSDLTLGGIHHLTAITANAPANKRFYTETLGLRLVKKTVNQDDTSAYHLFYADGLASPGTDLTFFDWPVGRERRGTHSISRTGLRIAADSFDFWAGRLRGQGLETGALSTTDGRTSLDFEDPEGQRYRLTADQPGVANPWDRSPVEAAHQIRALRDHPLQVPVRGADEAEVRVQGYGTADRAVGARLEQPEQLDLLGERDVPHLVQEERPVARGLDEPLFAGHGTSEGPALVAEELALEECFGEARALHGDEWAVRAQARRVDRPGRQLLAGPGLALQQHGGPARGHPVDALEHPVERG